MVVKKSEKITQAARELALRSVEARRRKCQKSGESFDEQMSILGKQGGKRSVEERRKKWGGRGFTKKMRNWGKSGGRPPKEGKRDAN
jgi:hypothetical protein